MTVFSDAAGNKYLGDCRWGNHDINYPTTNFLEPVDRTGWVDMSVDLQDIFNQSGYNNINVRPTTNTATNQLLFRFSPSSITSTTLANWGIDSSSHFNGNGPYASRWLNTVSYQEAASTAYIDTLHYLCNGNLLGSGYTTEPRHVRYVACAGSNSFGLMVYNEYVSNNSFISDPAFYYWGLLDDVNSNFNYYTNSAYNYQIHIRLSYVRTVSLNSTVSTLTGQDLYDYKSHYIVNAVKALLESGRAAYTISCSDGQTPGSQWATDMWVYDNNAPLGYPVIGRVPNMLLGVGDYTYLKPVKIQGTAVPDNGSPWYLPVGQFAGKVLLMRCYSSV